MTEEYPEPQTEIEPVDAPDAMEAEGDEESKMVPLSALQKQRRKNQELKEELERLRSQPQQTKEDDYSSYESATKGDLQATKAETMRAIREDIWADTHKEKAAFVEENLAQFLKEKPNLASAIQEAPNRIAEAYELMRLYHSHKQPAKAAPNRDVVKAPGNPSAVPKAAGVNEAVDVMSMSDEEFAAWRASKRRKH